MGHRTSRQIFQQKSVGPETLSILDSLEQLRKELVIIRTKQTGIIEEEGTTTPDFTTWPGDEHTPNSDRSIATTRTKIGVSGTLTAINIFIKTGVPRTGQVHARLVLEDEKDAEVTTLCRGYVYPGHEVYGIGALAVKSNYSIRLETRSAVASIVLQPRGTLMRNVTIAGGWTGVDKGSLEGPGAIRTIIGTDPAVNTEFSESVPTNARHKLLSVRNTLVTSGTAATRVVRLILDDGAAIFQLVPAAISQTASLTRSYTFGTRLPHNTTLLGADTNIISPLIENNLIQGSRIRSSTSALALGDNWSDDVMQVEEHIEE